MSVRGWRGTRYATIGDCRTPVRMIGPGQVRERLERSRSTRSPSLFASNCRSAIKRKAPWVDICPRLIDLPDNEASKGLLVSLD